MSERFQPSENVVDTELDDSEVALLELETKTYFSLNQTGARIWSGIKEGLALERISERLQQEFEVDAEHAEQSVLGLTEELLNQNLVKRV